MSKVKVIEKLKDDPLMPLRHTCEHVLHMAVQELFPKTKKVMGPPVEDGFYFDFDLDEKISPENFEAIEERMQEIIDADLKVKVHEISLEEAREIFSHNPYKMDTLDEISSRGEKVTLYSIGEEGGKHYDIDLCAGPHAESTGKIKAFKLLSVAGAYYKGSEKNKMLQRIYGTAFDNVNDLEKHLDLLEDAKKRDHRKLGKELDLYTFSELVGKGLPLFTEKGATIWRELERYVVDTEIMHGYKHVKTPTLAKADLYRKSGHYPYYADTMYPPMKYDEEELLLRPMTCPHHFMLFQDKPRSYKELPLRFGEVAQLYRYEKSGTLTGLLRVRSFCLADSHNFVQKDKAKDEVKEVIKLIREVTKSIGLVEGDDFIYRLSLGDRENKEKYYDSPEDWEYAEQLLREIMGEMALPGYEALNEAAFYGPKIDVQMKNVLGKEDTAFTVQYDFCMPKRFELKYVNEHGKFEQPVVIHRSAIGALERVIGFLIEKHAGAFPVWLAPVQAIIIPISDKHLEYARQVEVVLKRNRIRVEVDDNDEKMGAKIRTAQMQKVPYMLVVGDKEIASDSVSVRLRTEEDLGSIKTAELVNRINEKINSKSLEL